MDELPALSIRNAEVNDVFQIADIWNNGWHDAHRDVVPETLVELRTQESFRERTAALVNCARVVVTGSEVVGFHMLQENELYQMYVAPIARGAGAAQPLMRDALSKLASTGHSTAWLACAVGNTRAMRFYEKCGWRNTGVGPVELDVSTGNFTLDVLRYEIDLTAK